MTLTQGLWRFEAGEWKRVSTFRYPVYAEISDGGRMDLSLADCTEGMVIIVRDRAEVHVK